MVRLFESITHYLFDLIFNNQYLIYMLEWLQSLFHLSVDAHSCYRKRIQKREKNSMKLQKKKQNGHVSNSISNGVQEIEQYSKEPKIFSNNKNLSQTHNTVEKRKNLGKPNYTIPFTNQVNGNGHKMNEKTRKDSLNHKNSISPLENLLDDKGIGDGNEFDGSEKNEIKIGSYGQINRHGSISKVSDLILSHNNKIASVKGQPKTALTNTTNPTRSGKKTPTPSDITYSALKHFGNKAKKVEFQSTNSSNIFKDDSVENQNGFLKIKENYKGLEENKSKTAYKSISPVNVTKIFDERPLKDKVGYPDFEPPNLIKLLTNDKCVDIPIINNHELPTKVQNPIINSFEGQNNNAKNQKMGPLLMRKCETPTKHESIDENLTFHEKPIYDSTSSMTSNAELNLPPNNSFDTTADIDNKYLGSQDLTFSANNFKRRVGSREPQTSLYLEGRKRLVIIVTGGTRGLGLAMVRKFCRLIYGFEQDSFNFDESASSPADIAQCCFDIVITGRDDRYGAKLVSDLQYKLESALRNRDRTKGGGNSSHPLPQVNLAFQRLDVTDSESIKTFTNYVARQYGGVDVLINNAATCAENSNSSISSFQRFESNGVMRRSFRREAIKKMPISVLEQGPLYENGDEGADDDKRDVIFGKAFDEKTDSLARSPQDLDLSRMNDYEIAEITLRTNFWGLVDLYSSLFSIFRPHCRVVNITCSAGSPRNSVRSEIRTKLMNTVNQERRKSTHGNSIEAEGQTKNGSSSWFSSSYFNINFGKVDKNAVKDCRNSKAPMQSSQFNVIKSFEELEDLMKSYLKATKEGLRAKEGWSGSHYSISKMAVTVLTAVLQQTIDQCNQGNEKDIIINTCCPGYIKTGMNGHKGNIGVDEGCETPVYLALLPPNALSPRGNFVCQKRIKEWR